MSQTVVKFITNDEGDKDDGKWHYAYHNTGNQKLCTGEFYGVGESSVEYKTKEILKGGITCTQCLRIIKKLNK